MTSFISTSAPATSLNEATNLPVGNQSTVSPNNSVVPVFTLSQTSTHHSNNNTAMYSNRQIKEIESKILYDFVHAMPYVDRKYFITNVITLCQLPRRHFYNWQDGYARIPSFAKVHIEAVAGQPLFESTRGM